MSSRGRVIGKLTGEEELEEMVMGESADIVRDA